MKSEMLFGTLSVIVLSAACSGPSKPGPSAAPTCEAAANQVATVAIAGATSTRAQIQAEIYRDEYIEACTKGQWSAASQSCFTAAGDRDAQAACRDGLTPPQRDQLGQLSAERMYYTPRSEGAETDRAAVQAAMFVPLWGYPPLAGDDFAPCATYEPVVQRVRNCFEGDEAAYASWNERDDAVLDIQNNWDPLTPRQKAMWRGYCDAMTKSLQVEHKACLEQPTAP